MNSMHGFILSLDPAQIRDWSALSATEVIWNNSDRSFHYQLRNIERRQSLPYPEIVDWTIKAFRTKAFREGSFGPILTLDTTGVGVAIKDMIRKGGLRPISITITSGNSHTHTGLEHNVGKLRLVSKFLSVFDAGKFLIPSIKAPAFIELQKELRAFRADMSAKGYARFEAEQGEHDDMVLSIAMSVWLCEDVIKGPPPPVPTEPTAYGVLIPY